VHHFATHCQGCSPRRVEKERGGKVAGALLCDGRALRHVDGVDVSEFDTMPEHFAVHHTYDEFAHAPLRLRVAEPMCA